MLVVSVLVVSRIYMTTLLLYPSSLWDDDLQHIRCIHHHIICVRSIIIATGESVPEIAILHVSELYKCIYTHDHA